MCTSSDVTAGDFWVCRYSSAVFRAHTLPFDIISNISQNGNMDIEFPLPPHLRQFVSEQLATGHFQSEREVIHTALHLLEERYHSRDASTVWLKQEIARGMRSRASEPVTKEFWHHIRNRLAANNSPVNEA